MFKGLNCIVLKKGPRYRDINDIRGKVGRGGRKVLFQEICSHVWKGGWLTSIKGRGQAEKNYRFRTLILIHTIPLISTRHDLTQGRFIAEDVGMRWMGGGAVSFNIVVSNETTRTDLFTILYVHIFLKTIIL